MKENRFLSPGKGKVCKLKEFPDEVISDGTLGDGFALYLEDDFIVAPFNGEVTIVYPTGHAICLVSDDGAQMMIHIGAETFNIIDLNKTYIKVGDRVEKGDRLIKTSVKDLKKKTGSSAMAVVFLNGEKVSDLKEKDVKHLEIVCTLNIKEND